VRPGLDTIANDVPFDARIPGAYEASASRQTNRPEGLQGPYKVASLNGDSESEAKWQGGLHVSTPPLCSSHPNPFCHRLVSVLSPFGQRFVTETSPYSSHKRPREALKFTSEKVGTSVRYPAARHESIGGKDTLPSVMDAAPELNNNGAGAGAAGSGGGMEESQQVSFDPDSDFVSDGQGNSFYHFYEFYQFYGFYGFYMVGWCSSAS